MPRPSLIKTGDIIETKYGPIEILRFVSHKEIHVVCHKNDGRAKDYYCIVNNYNLNPERNFRCPYDRRYYGIGYIGEGVHPTRGPIFNAWCNMLKRCYTNSERNYSDVFVCDDWQCFQNFATWASDKHFKDANLDKDLLTDSREYSPSSCCFLPKEINTSLALERKRNKDNSLPLGVYKSKKKYRVGIRTKDGDSFGTMEEAMDEYCKRKQINLEKLAEKYDDVLSEKSKMRLVNYVKERIKPRHIKYLNEKRGTNGK